MHHVSSRSESYEDLLSDSASIASDISDSSLNSSLLGKRTLAPLAKVTHKFSITQVWLHLVPPGKQQTQSQQ